MAFNPLLPVDDSIIEAPELRGQLSGLFDLIQTIPVGPVGPAGVNAAVIDGVTTGNPGESAAVLVALNAGTLHFSFSIPRGDVGTTGVTGTAGADGGVGPTGAVGPAFTSFAVDSVTTLPAGQPATVQTSFDGSTVRFIFAIPQGAQGAQGPQGAGDLSGTSSNSNSVSPLAMSVSDPPTLTQVQTLANKVDELIAALRR